MFSPTFENVASDNKAYHYRFGTGGDKLHHHSDVISIITTGPAFNLVVTSWTLSPIWHTIQ
jgi:hypothetical protein